jgi:hypothetical protein
MQVAIVFDSWRFLSDAENLRNFTGQVCLSRLSRGGGGKKICRRTPLAAV